MAVHPGVDFSALLMVKLDRISEIFKNLKEFESPEAMIKDIGKNVRSMPQIKINDELVGGYNQLIEHYNKQGLVDFKGNKISE